MELAHNFRIIGVSIAYAGLIFQKKYRSAKLLHVYWPNLPSWVGNSSVVQSTSLLSSKLPFSHLFLFIGETRVKLQNLPSEFLLGGGGGSPPLVLFFIYITFSSSLLMWQVVKLFKMITSKAMTKFNVCGLV